MVKVQQSCIISNVTRLKCLKHLQKKCNEYLLRENIAIIKHWSYFIVTEMIT